jgi:hypothetical protein
MRDVDYQNRGKSCKVTNLRMMILDTYYSYYGQTYRSENLLCLLEAGLPPSGLVAVLAGVERDDEAPDQVVGQIVFAQLCHKLRHTLTWRPIICFTQATLIRKNPGG